jgi:predicted dehydrogenase
MIMKKVNWGILGVAKIAVNQLIPAIIEAPNAQLYGIASRDGEKAIAASEKFGCKAFTGYEALLADEQIDAIYIPLPNEMHMEWTIRAAKAGKHVLCEKPLGLNVAQCESMIKVCKENNVLLMEAFMYRYSEKTKKTIEIIESGRLGKLTHINSSFRFKLTDYNNNRFYPNGGGSLYDVGCYPINFINMIMGEDPIEVYGVRTDNHGVDVSFAAVLKYKEGLTATLDSGFNSEALQRTEICGTDAVLIVTNPFFDGAEDLILTTRDSQERIPVKEGKRYTQQVIGFSNAILEGGQLLMPLEDTIRNMTLIERLYSL